VRAIRDALRGASRFTHDAVGRLIGAIAGDGSTEYFEHDSASNRRMAARTPPGKPPEPTAVIGIDARGHSSLDVAALRSAGATIEQHQLGEGNRTIAVSRPDREVRYELDALGRVVAKRVDTRDGNVAAWRYRWDGLGQLLELTTPDGSSWRYDYDGIGRRRAKHGPSGTTTFVWFGRSLLHVVGPDGKLTTWVPELERRASVARDEDGTLAYVVPDHLGGVSELVDEQGHLLWMAKHEAWGADADERQPMRFPGQWYDAESGLHYNGFRYYDPELGKYISPDPIGIIGGFNEYAYVPSPLTWVDPDGLVVTGGPYSYTGGNSTNPTAPPNTPDITNHRGVENPRTQMGNTVPAPNPATDSRGKTLAVLQQPGGGDREAFVSGHGRPIAASPDGTHGWGTSTHAYGNWCHAEMHALGWLRFQGQNGTLAGQHFQLFIDRPPCNECNASLHLALAELHGQPHNLTIDVFYHTNNPGDGEHAGWNRFPPAGAHGCGG
jgi:RHS repeat-associated protein